MMHSFRNPGIPLYGNDIFQIDSDNIIVRSVSDETNRIRMPFAMGTLQRANHAAGGKDPFKDAINSV